jgi:acryloyl-coenzyme A reductase
LEERPRFLGEDVDGGYAEYVKVRHDIVLPVPGTVSLQKAAVITCTLGTAYHAIATQADVSAGDTVVITGASGGVGIHAVKIAKPSQTSDEMVSPCRRSRFGGKVI